MSLLIPFFAEIREYFLKHRPYTELLYQYRMAPEICELPSNLMYGGELITHVSVLKRDYITGYEQFYREFPELKGHNVALYSYKEANRESPVS